MSRLSQLQCSLIRIQDVVTSLWTATRPNKPVRLLSFLIFSFLSITFISHAATGPSAFCHATDGALTACPDGHIEWSDIQPTFFAPSGSYLYADQANLTNPVAPPNTFL